MRIDATTPIHITLPGEGPAPSAPLATPSSGGTSSPDGVSFADIFARTVEQANQADHLAAQKVDALARGVSDDLHGTMIATKEADISVKLVGSIRNKLLDAFQEIWRTSV